MTTATRERTANWSLIHATEDLRHAEARLARRRQADCGPGETDRAAMRYILERFDDGRPAKPVEVARAVDISTASTTVLLDRLAAGGMIRLVPNPDDRRSKLIVPLHRSDDPDKIDPLTAQIEDLASDLTDDEARIVEAYLRRVTDAVSERCS